MDAGQVADYRARFGVDSGSGVDNIALLRRLSGAQPATRVHGKVCCGMPRALPLLGQRLSWEPEVPRPRPSPAQMAIPFNCACPLDNTTSPWKPIAANSNCRSLSIWSSAASAVVIDLSSRGELTVSALRKRSSRDRRRRAFQPGGQRAAAE